MGTHGALICCGLKAVPLDNNAKVLALPTPLPVPLNVSTAGGRFSKGVIGWTLPYVTVVLIRKGNQDTAIQKDDLVRIFL